MSETVWIRLTQGKSALIDAECLQLAEAYSWYALQNKRTGDFYACAKTRWPDGRRRVLGLHRLMLGDPPGRVDHINGDTLDCRRDNLRPATSSQNRANSRMNRNNLSGYRGVYPRKGYPGYFEAWATVDGKPRYLGAFSDATAAARAHDDVAFATYGQYARLNFPPPPVANTAVRPVAPSVEHRRVRSDNSSGFRGVTRDSRIKDRDIWIAQISVNGQMRRLGSFSIKEDAARAYDAVAREAFGIKARLNFPSD